MFWCTSIFLVAFGASTTLAMDNLRVVYQWNQLSYNFKTENDKIDFLESGRFIPENNIPMGIEVVGRRIFITTPRWKHGVPASLSYISHTGDNDSPILHPYPNWEAHQSENDSVLPEIVSPFRMRADRCGHLWVLDSGVANILEPQYKNSVPPSIIVFDLNDDTVLRRYELPEGQYVQNKSLFANIAIEDSDCSKIYAYIADISSPGLVVYSWKDNDSWLVNHNYFNIDPLAGEFNVSGIVFHWTDGIFGLGLSDIKPDGSCDLYFHPMTSTDEFVVSTKFLKDKDLSQKSNGEFKHLGSRGPKGQSSVSFLDKKTGVLFYALINLNAIACWKTSNPRYTMQSQGRVYMSNVTMVFPSDIKVDSDDNMWVLSNRLPIFMYMGLNTSEVNFRLLTAPVKDAINGTACDAKGIVTPEMKAKMKDHLDTINPPKPTTRASQSGAECFNNNNRVNAVVVFLAVLNLLLSVMGH